MPKRRWLKERFMEKLPADCDPDKCWEWEGTRYPHGYGRIFLSTKDNKCLYAHRVAWELASDQKIPDGLQVNHHCDNRPCVNPAHLYVGTQADNMKDRCDRGRTRNGLPHVPDEIVREAVALVKSGLTYRAAALRVRSKGYPCSYPSVWQWVNGNIRRSAFKQIQEDRTLSDTPSNTTCEVDQVESLQGKGEQLCLFTT